MGLTIIDALDSLWIMDMKEEFNKARDWIANSLDFNQDKQVSFFESTIRITGGLLSAFELSGDRMLLDKAIQVQESLNEAFKKTATGLPISSINLVTGAGETPGWTGNNLILAEIATNSLEFHKLTQHSRDPTFSRLTEHVTEFLDTMDTGGMTKGLYPTLINPSTGTKASNKVSVGGMGDSWFEYELKTWILLAKTNKRYRRMYLESIEAIRERMVGELKNGNKYISTLDGVFKSGKMEHLACFLPGTLALGVHHGVARDGAEANAHMDLANGLMDLCYQMYTMTPSKLAPDSVNVRSGYMRADGMEFRLRPESVESIFYMWRTTHDQKYREMAWNIFVSIDTHCKVEGVGHASLVDVNHPTQKGDRMESFWLAETLKYIYLTFEDDAHINIDEWVFNTEAHPFRVISSEEDLQYIYNALTPSS